jgi:ketosteroid isomerase-like protein
MSTIVTDAPGLADLARAIEARDAAAQKALYADDAVLTTIDAEHGPSNPDVARGKDAIGAQLADVCSRDMTHEVAFFVHGGDRAAIAVNCRYPDGTRVVCQATLTLRDGKIAEQVTLQAWDS